MTRTAFRSKRKVKILQAFDQDMRDLHPRINPQEHRDIVGVIGDLTRGGSTTISEVVDEMRKRGSTLSEWQIRSRMRDLEKKSYVTGKRRVLFFHQTIGAIHSWNQLMQLLRDLQQCLNRNRSIAPLVSSDMGNLQGMRATGNFLGFVGVYNRIIAKIGRACGLHFVEIRGLPKKIELSVEGVTVYHALSSYPPPPKPPVITPPVITPPVTTPLPQPPQIQSALPH